MTPEGERYVLGDEAVEGAKNIGREDFLAMSLQIEKDGKTVTNPDYINYVAPARQAYAHAVTQQSPKALVLFIVVLLMLLISMATFRSPAVALMPDVTLKANAVINLMGSAGGILVLVLGMVFATGSARNALMSYTVFLAVVAALMIVALIIFLCTVREKRFVAEMEADSRKYGLVEEEKEDGGEVRKLSKGEIRSLIFILASIIMWFAGYNAVTSKYSVYADKVLSRDYNMTLIIAQAAAIISYLPVGMIASRVGRKKCILAGVGLYCGGVHSRRFQHAADQRAVLPGGHCLGDHQCELLPDGG